MAGSRDVDPPAGDRLVVVAERLDAIEAKLDEVLKFCDLVATAAAPLMAGKGKVWMALLAKSRGSAS